MDELQDMTDVAERSSGFDLEGTGVSTIDVDDLTTADAGPAYATFLIGQTEIALPTAYVREVVWYPENVTAVPLTPSCVRGIFSLRGEIVPILDLSQLMEIEPAVEQAEAKVGIIECVGGCVGFVLDKTGGVLRPAPAEIRSVEESGDSDGGILAEVIHDRQRERIVQVVSVEKLGNLSGIPLCPDAGTRRAEVDNKTYRKSIVIRLGEMEIGLRVEDVLEVQADLTIDKAPRYFPHCCGVVQLRGEVYPVLDCRAALGLPTQEESPRFLFIEHDGAVVAALVDSLVETLEYPEDAVLAMPRLLATDMSTICQNVISVSPERHVLLMTVSELFRRYEICRVPGGATGERSAEEVVDTGTELSFLAFSIGGRTLCVSMDYVVEIQEVGEGAFSAGSGDGLSAGLMNLRGTILPLLDGNAIIGDNCARPDVAALALILSLNGELFGLLVSAIVDIKRVSSSSVSSCNHFVAGENQGLMQYVDQAFLAECKGASELFVVLDVEALTRAQDMPELPKREVEGADTPSFDMDEGWSEPAPSEIPGADDEPDSWGMD